MLGWQDVLAVAMIVMLCPNCSSASTVKMVAFWQETDRIQCLMSVDSNSLEHSQRRY